MDNFLDNAFFETNPEAGIVLMEAIWRTMSEDGIWIGTDLNPTISEPEEPAPLINLTMKDIWNLIEKDLGHSDPNITSPEPKEASPDGDNVLAKIRESTEEDLMLMKSKVDLDATLFGLGDSWKVLKDNLGIKEVTDEIETDIWKLIEDDLLSLLRFNSPPICEPEEASVGTE